MTLNAAIHTWCVIADSCGDLQRAAQQAATARFNRQQSLVVDRMVDSLTLEAAISYGGARKPSATQALKRHLHKAAERLPSLATPASLAPLDAQPVLSASLAAQDSASLPQDSASLPQDSASVPQDSASLARDSAIAAVRSEMPVTATRDYTRENAAALEAAYEVIRQTEGIRSEKDGAAILEAAYAIIREAEGIHSQTDRSPNGLIPAQHAQQALAMQPQPGNGAITAVPRLHSIDSINALVWPLSRRVSSASSRGSDHLQLYVDHGGDHLQLFVDHSQQSVTFPRLRSTASINALVWPASRRVSSADGRSPNTAVAEAIGVIDGTTTAVVDTSFRPLPSAASIDSLLWPGDVSSAAHAEPAEILNEPSVSSRFRLPLLPLPPPPPRAGPSSARARKQQSLLDRAAAKRALASLLAAAKASQIRGWSPRQQGTSPAPAESAPQEAASAAVPVGLPSLADIEALCLEEDNR